MLPNLVSLIPLLSPALLPTLHLSTSLVYATGPPYPLISLPTLPFLFTPCTSLNLCCSIYCVLRIQQPVVFVCFSAVYLCFNPYCDMERWVRFPQRISRLVWGVTIPLKPKKKSFFSWLFWNLWNLFVISPEALTSSWLYSNETIRDGKKKKISLCLTRSQFRDLSSSW